MFINSSITRTLLLMISFYESNTFTMCFADNVCIWLKVFLLPHLFYIVPQFYFPVSLLCVWGSVLNTKKSNVSTTPSLTFIGIPITFTFFYVKFWTLLGVITEVCSSVIIFIVSVCCKYILCLEENHQREASSLNKSPCPRYERPSFRGQLQGCLHECFKQYDMSYYITTSCLLIDRPHYISIFMYCMCLDAI